MEGAELQIAKSFLGVTYLISGTHWSCRHSLWGDPGIWSQEQTEQDKLAVELAASPSCLLKPKAKRARDQLKQLQPMNILKTSWALNAKSQQTLKRLQGLILAAEVERAELERRNKCSWGYRPGYYEPDGPELEIDLKGKRARDLASWNNRTPCSGNS